MKRNSSLLKQIASKLVLGSVVALGVSGAVVEASENGFGNGTLSYSDYNRADKYLYTVTLNDYNYQQYLETRTDIYSGMCSAVWNEKYFGRNFDWFLDDAAQAVVKVPSAEGRFASIGIAGMYSRSNDLATRLNELSYKTLDGINENGVAVSLNVCTKEDGRGYIGSTPATGTNPGKPYLSIPAVVRYVLDNAKSAEDIVHVLQNDVNIVSDDALGEKTGVHFMIGDSKGCYIVEFVNGAVEVSRDTVMTNFFNTLHDKAIDAGYSDANGIETFVNDGNDEDFRQEYPMGVERYKVLKQYYDEGKLSMEDMAKLMQRAHYRQVSCPDDPETYFYSENAHKGEGDDDKKIQDIYADKDTLFDSEKDYWDEIWASGKTWEDLRNSGIWQTTSSSVYDLNNLMLLLYIQEQYNKPFNFSLTVQDIMGVNSHIAGDKVITAMYQGNGNSVGTKFVKDIVNSTTYIGGAPTLGKKQAAKMLNAVGNMGEAGGVLHGTAAVLSHFSDNICGQMSITNRPSVAGNGAKLINTANITGNTLAVETVPSGNADKIMPQAQAPKTERQIWADYLHSKEKVDGIKLCGIEAQYSMQFNGITVGADLWNSKNNLGGVAIMYAGGNTNGSSGDVNTRNKTDYYGIGAYNRKDFVKNFSILYDLNYMHSKNDIKQFNNNTEITAAPRTNTISMGVRAEKMFGNAKGQITPFAGLRYNRIDNGGYSNNLGIRYETHNMNVFNVPVGVKFSCVTQDRGWTFTPYAELGYIKNLGDRNNKTEMSYGGVSDSFGYDVLDKGALSVKAGMGATKGNLTVNVGYNHMKSKHSHNNKWNIGFNICF